MFIFAYLVCDGPIGGQWDEYIISSTVYNVYTWIVNTYLNEFLDLELTSTYK